MSVSTHEQPHMRLSVNGCENFGEWGITRHIRQARFGGDLVVRVYAGIEIIEDALRVHVADPHQPERRAEDHRRHPVLMNNKRFPRGKILYGKIDRERYRVTSVRAAGFDV